MSGTSSLCPSKMRSAPNSRNGSPSMGRATMSEKRRQPQIRSPVTIQRPSAFPFPPSSSPTGNQLHLPQQQQYQQQQQLPGRKTDNNNATTPPAKVSKSSPLAERLRTGRSCSKPCNPGLSPASARFSPLSLTLSHHSSFDSDALARDFFGHQRDSVSDLFGLRRAPVISSPLLRRQADTEEEMAEKGGCPSPCTAPPPLPRINLPDHPCAASPLSTRSCSRHFVQNRTSSVESSGSGSDPPSPSSYFRVVVLGEQGVGKSSLIRQMTACACPCDGSAGRGQDVEEEEMDTERVVVNVRRKNELCTVEIFDSPLNANIDTLRPDAFIIMYSVSNRKSYVTAKEVTRHLRMELGMDRPVFLVANKTDLRRQQRISAKEAKTVAETYDCSFMETSAALHVNVDRLLDSVLDQILQKLLPPGEVIQSNIRCAKEHTSMPRRALRFLSKVLRHSLLIRRSSIDKMSVDFLSM